MINSVKVKKSKMSGEGAKMLKGVYVIYSIPWLACEPEDAYEDISAVTIVGVTYSLSAAKQSAREYAAKLSDNGYKLVEDDKKCGDYKFVIYADIKNISTKSVEFNTLNGYAVVVKLVS